MQRKPLLKTYDVVFHNDMLDLYQFGMKGSGRFFINEEEGIVEMDADESHSTLVKLPGKAIGHLPIFGWVMRLILDYEFADAPLAAFPQAAVIEVTRNESTISFRAPAKFGSIRFKRVRFSASSLEAAQEIEGALNAKPSERKPVLKSHPYRRNETLERMVILKSIAVAILMPVLFILFLAMGYFAWTTLGYYGIAIVLAALFVFIMWRAFRNKSKDVTSINLNSK